MKSNFFYSILKYRYNQLTEESLNLGVLFIFADEDRVSFVAPKSLKRLQQAFPEANIQDINGYLKSFESRAKKLKAVNVYADNFQNLVHEAFLIPNGSALFFEELRSAPVWKNITSTVQHFTDQYLVGYGERDTGEKVRLHNERYIIDSYKKLLSSKTEGRQLSAFVNEVPVVVQNQITSFSSDLSWQNGTQNLIKAVSFDLISEEHIENKALALAKKLEILKSTFERQGQRVDILLSKPRRPELKHLYYNAKTILAKAEAPHKLIEEKSFESYAEDVVESAR